MNQVISDDQESTGILSCLGWFGSVIMAQDRLPGGKESVRRQFGRASKAYATSDVHARGESLDVLCDLLNPQPTWAALDIATGAGHTALRLAPHVASVVATDLTPQMLAQTQQLANELQIQNVSTEFADAEELPFEDDCFDLVTCRLAYHHFVDRTQALAEMARVTRPGGWLGFTDNFAVDDPDAADYYNRYEKLRDPSHQWVGPLDEINDSIRASGYQLIAERKLCKEFEFGNWADRQQVDAHDRESLLEMMRKIPRR